jgi:RHS repeat-associated protein
VSYHYDRAGRIDRVTGQPTDSSSFATNITYAPHGALASMRLGVTSTNPGWNESWQYNERLQPASVSVGAGLLSLAFSYCPSGAASCTTNNGNLVRQTITRSGVTWTQNYVNDAVNRLNTAQESLTGGGTPWTETYDYDRYGNRWLTGYPGLPAPNAETPTAQAWYLSNNRIAGWEYSDGRGNITAIPFMQRSFSYDGENHQTSATVNGVTATYAYDGNGRRIKKSVKSVITTYVYDALGHLAAEYSSNVATGIGTQYRHVDHLGSTRLVVNANGSPVPSGCHDFRPFGQELLAGTDGRDATCFPSMPAASLEFTGKERDNETNLDYFGARYYSAAAGRFTGPDPSRESGNASNPQSWNRYAYTYNNPLQYVDPNGKWPTEIHSAILNGAFKGLTDTQLKALGSGSSSVDYSLLGQTLASRAYQHGMRAPGETDQDLNNKMVLFVFDHELAAENSWLDAGGIDSKALREFGKAMHPLMDSTSPAHADKIYGGIPSLPKLGTLGLLLDGIAMWRHIKEEAKITLELYHKNIDIVRAEYLKTFGEEEFFKATGCKKVEGCPYDDVQLREAYRAK